MVFSVAFFKTDSRFFSFSQFHIAIIMETINSREGKKMELRTAASPRDVKHYTTERLREEFLIPRLFFEDEIKLV